MAIDVSVTYPKSIKWMQLNQKHRFNEQIVFAVLRKTNSFHFIGHPVFSAVLISFYICKKN